nr:DNA mismatch repair protein MutS [Candidatus Prometheoarchaeum syntrophicum]QEE14418.1 DNA mismatch repair protein MutS [Candidatus Prometheoarchaeum syntrophicum]
MGIFLFCCIQKNTKNSYFIFIVELIYITISEKEEDITLGAEELYRSGKMPEMMKHWYSVRKQYPPEFLLAYRMGDFYEFFYDDAINVAKLLGLTLTKRGSGPSRHPLAGIPHKATQHFKTLVKQGQTIIIVEQLEDPKKAKGKIVKRGVVRILSPGTVVDDNLLDSKSANYICSVFRDKKNYGVAIIDISSADFIAAEFFGKQAKFSLFSFIAKNYPVECILPQELLTDFSFMSQLRESSSMIIKEHTQFSFLFNNAYETLRKQFEVENLNSFDLEDRALAISAAGALLAFIKETQKEETLDNIQQIRYFHEDSFMFLDVNTQKNLELLCNQNDGGTFGSIFGVLNETKTPMGTRLLKNWIVQPLIIKKAIERRLEIVEFFIKNYEIRSDLRNYLGQMGDLARLISRINYSSTVNARNLLNTKRCLEIIEHIKQIFAEIKDPLLLPLITELKDFQDVINLIEKSIHEQPPVTITEGGIIKEGYNPQIDEYRDILNNGKNWILKFEEGEKRKLNLSTGLKISYNRVIGYFIQITNNALKSITVPADYVQRQTIKNGVRYETERLKEMETKILSADENLMDLEYKIFQEIRKEIQKYTVPILKNAKIISELDVLSTFAEIAQFNNYCKPKIENHKRIVIKQGRHPVVEQVNKKEQFIPNDTLMDNDHEQILIITGPNWSGKSTYLRQTALIVLFAQIGCYVPAISAEIGIVDRIFTRIGASDDLIRGQSTFMLEMTEMSQIINYTTDRSLIVIDELGRGTGTADGRSIAQAVIEYLHNFGVKTLFSTHFHQLINLKMPKVHNYHFKIIEKPDTKKLIFLRQLTDGGTDKSYGIHVAMMAGLPKSVTERAFGLIDGYLNGSEKLIPSQIQRTSPKLKKSQRGIQTSLFPIKKYEDSDLVIMLRSADLDNMTPIQAFEFLYKLKKKLKSGEK